MRQFLISVLEVFEVAFVAIGAVFLVRTFLVQPFLVSGASMAPSFQSGDYLLVDQLSYYFRKPERGEVVVFRYPKDETTYFIKRIIGLPGEHVTIENGKITVFNSQNQDGLVLSEEYLSGAISTVVRPGGQSNFTLGEKEYLVLGDNRAYSFDSRDWGVLETKNIIGLARLRLWPVKELTVFAAPAYNL